MTFWYTARAIFDEHNQEEGKTWDSYIAWYALPHVKEMVSLDTLLNPLLVEPDYKNPGDWDYIVSHDKWLTGFLPPLTTYSNEPRKQNSIC